MVTPISLPPQRNISTAPGNTPSNSPHRETAFVFNFNSPAISHDDLTETSPIGGATNGMSGSFGPSGDVFQPLPQKTDPSGNPAQDAFTSAFAQASQPQGEATPFAPMQPQWPTAPDTGNTQVAQPAFNPATHLQWLQQQNQQPAQPVFGEAMPQAPVSAMPFPLPMLPKMPMQPMSMGQISPFAMPPAFRPAFPPQLPFPLTPPGSPPISPTMGPMALPQPSIQPPAQLPTPTQSPIQQATQLPMPPQIQPTNQASMPSSMVQPPFPAPGMSTQAPAQQAPTYPTSVYGDGQNFNTTPISDLNTMIAQPRTPDEKLAALDEIATRQQGDRQTYELLKLEIATPMQGIPPETASAIRQAALIALGSLCGSPVNAQYAGNELMGQVMSGIEKILRDKNENPLIKASAVASLGYMNRPQDKTIHRLLKLAAKDNNPDVKNAVAQVQAGQLSGPAPNPPKIQ